MGSPNSTTPGTVLSKLPEWFGGIIGATCASGRAKRTEDSPQAESVTPGSGPNEAPVAAAAANREIQTVIDEMLSQNRYALLLRPQLIKNLSLEQLARTRAALADGMCLVPEGQIVVRRASDDGETGQKSAGGPLLSLEAFYLDRYPVTNGQYYHFVATGGYEQMQIWDPEIWPALLDFVDSTGHPGPRFWKNGRFARGEENHPVIGVNWYEAVAYARWVGKRLPSDAEWVKAGSWPVSIPGHPLLMRRYPWGEAMDRSRANLWGSGPGRTVSVYEFPGGVSVGGVQQLIGNVWEWTADAFAFEGTELSTVQTKMKSVRGGAFDTYLDNQATCHFQSADVALRASTISDSVAPSSSATFRRGRMTRTPSRKARQNRPSASWRRTKHESRRRSGIGFVASGPLRQPDPLLDLRRGQYSRRRGLSQLLRSDDPRPSGPVEERQTRDVRGTGAQRRRKDRVPGHAVGHALAAAEALAAFGPRAAFPSRCSTTRWGRCAVRVSQQDAQRARPLELGPLPVAQPEAPPAGRNGAPRHGRRSAVRGGRTPALLSCDPFAAEPVRRRDDLDRRHKAAVGLNRRRLLHDEAAQPLVGAGGHLEEFLGHAARWR